MYFLALSSSTDLVWDPTTNVEAWMNTDIALQCYGSYMAERKNLCSFHSYEPFLFSIIVAATAVAVAIEKSLN